MTFRKIVFPVAFSDRCRGAAPYVRAFARRFASDVELLHIIEAQYAVVGAPELALLPDEETTEELTRRAKEKLFQFRTDFLDDVNTSISVKTGDPADVIASIAREEMPNIIMMPTHGYGPFRRFILGSVTAKVLHDVSCAVWTGAHTEEAPPDPVPSLSRILCAVDLQNKSLCTIKFAHELAQAWEAKLELVHTITAPEAQPGKALDSKFRSFLYEVAHEKITAFQKEAGVNVPVHINGGDISHYVRDVAVQRQSDLLVIGRGVHSVFGRLRTHSYALIRESPCPVVSI
jgi:nucleotide-binding universal stress UspA family protein